MTERIQPQLFPFRSGVIAGVRKVVLDNGIPVFLIEAGTEDVMRIEFIFRAGAVKEDLPLCASSVNQMLTEGSQNYSAEEMNRILDFHGIFLNPAAEKDYAGITLYFISRQIDKVLELSNEILFRPVFPQEELNLLMNKRIRWFQVNREKVQNLASDQFFESIFGSGHPYGRQLVESDFGRITPGILIDFHSRYYRPDNLAILISGRIHERTDTLLNNYFGQLRREDTYHEGKIDAPSGQERRKVKIQKPGALQSSIRIGSASINKKDQDYIGLKILNTILGGYFGSRLMKNIREDKGYTYGIHSSLSSLELSGFKLIATDVAGHNVKQALDEIYHEIKNLCREPVPGDELEVVRNFMSGELVRMFDGPFALAESFKAAWEFGMDFSYYNRFAQKIETITPDEIMWLARTYYNPDDLYEIVAGENT